MVGHCAIIAVECFPLVLIHLLHSTPLHPLRINVPGCWTYFSAGLMGKGFVVFAYISLPSLHPKFVSIIFSSGMFWKIMHLYYNITIVLKLNAMVSISRTRHDMTFCFFMCFVSSVATTNITEFDKLNSVNQRLLSYCEVAKVKEHRKAPLHFRD